MVAKKLIGHNGDDYHFTANLNETGGVIILSNTKTGDEWVCRVTYNNVVEFWTLPQSKHDTNFFAKMPCTAIGLLQDALHTNWHAVSLIHKHSPYYMELRLKYSFGDLPLEWTFPMVPTSVGDIEKRTKAELLKQAIDK